MVYFTPPDKNDSFTRIILDGDEYLFRFSYNYEGEFWTLGIYQSEEAPIVAGMKITPCFPVNWYPTNKEESQIRVNFLIQAVCDLQCLASQLDIAKGIVEHNDKDKAIKPTVWEQWARLISTELKLVVALKKSLQGKYNLEPKPE